MADLGWDVARLVRLAYPTADSSTREVIGFNAEDEKSGESGKGNVDVETSKDADWMDD